MNKLFVFFFLTVLATSSVTAQIPRTISYQGLLTDAQGIIIPDGAHSITLKFYEDINSNVPIYGETQNIQVSKGIFNVNIGSVNPIPVNIKFDRTYFLGVSIDFSAELSPRTSFTSSPYSLHSETSKIAESLTPGATGVVTSINSTQGNISLLGAGGTTVNQQGNTITISSIGGGGQGIQGVQNADGILNIQNGNGPIATIGINTNGVLEENCLVFRSGRWQAANKSKYNFDSDIFQETVTQPFLGNHFISLKTNGVNENYIPKFRNGKWQFLPPLEIIAGSGINLSTVTPGPDKITISAVDNSTSNEIQTLSFNSGSKLLSISQGNTVDLSSLGGSGSSWTISGNNIYNSNSGNVGIGLSAAPQGKLQVEGSIVVSNSGQRFNIAPRANGQIAFEANGVSGDNTFVIDDGNDKSVNIGTDAPVSGFKLNVVGKAKFKDGVFFGNTEGFTDGGTGVIRVNSSVRPDVSGQRDLGSATAEFKDLHLSGRVYFGTTESLSDGGTNTISLNSSLRPDVSNSRDLGTSTHEFKDLHLSGNVFFGSVETLSEGGSNTIKSNSTIRPDVNNSRDLGTSAQRWRDVWCSRNAFNGSDIRMKKEIQPLQMGLNVINKLNAYSYKWKEESMDDGFRHFGIMAQDLKEIVPELVREANDDHKTMSVNYTGLIPILLNAVKEQQQQINEMKSVTSLLKDLTPEEIAKLKAFLKM
ncbi:MAG: tail fiber domain-containing protein [Saprospiraceae bacterium]|nr:tail fiber domain-containing protein [Saprospiraceae bacterium]